MRRHVLFLAAVGAAGLAVLLSSAAGARPGVTLTATPPLVTSTTTATFKWIARPGTRRTRCRLRWQAPPGTRDKASSIARRQAKFRRCSSPKKWTKLVRGRYTFVLIAAGRRTSMRTRYSWRVVPGSAPRSQFSGTFDCFGSTTNCPTNSASGSCTTTLSSGGNIANAIASASAGKTVCLGAGTYGAVSLSSVRKASDVIVRPVNGATVSIGRVTMNGRTNHIRFSGQGATLSVAGFRSSNGDVLSHIKFDHVVFTDCVNFWIAGSSTANVFDHDRLEGLGQNLPQCSAQPDDHAAWEVSASNNAASHGTAITLSNSLIKDGCGDGIHVRSPGVVLGPGDVITGRHYRNCSDDTHVDGIQCGGADGMVLYDSYIHDNSTALQCGAGLGSERNITVYNNVFGNNDNYSWACACGANVNDRFEHNYMYGGVCIGKDTGHSPSGNVSINNVWNYGTGGVGVGCQDGQDGNRCPGCHATHNMNPGGEPAFRGTGSITEKRVKLVSSPSSGYYHYALAPGSAGYNRGSDGKPMGICATCGPRPR